MVGCTGPRCALQARAGTQTVDVLRPGRHRPDYGLAGHNYTLPYVPWTEKRNMQGFLTLVAEGKVTPGKMVFHRIAIAEAEKVYELMSSGAPNRP